jgi:dTDP-N-acetylfucosamine:lipid II N-acetylfucosaminyltransferase
VINVFSLSRDQPHPSINGVACLENRLKIAHFVEDEKFIDLAYESFEAVAPGVNYFFVPGRDRPLRYIKRTPVSFVPTLSFRNPFFFRYLRSYSFVVLHSVTGFNAHLLAYAPKGIKFIWIGHGYDYYDMICDQSELLLERTKRIASKFRGNKRNHHVWGQAKDIGRRLLLKSLAGPELVSKVQFFAPVLFAEYEMIRRRFGDKVAPYIDWNYGELSLFKDEEGKESSLKGTSILVGNSATVTNNHIDALEQLAAVGIGGRTIICPLSYGDKGYAEYVEDAGRSLFGNRFFALRSFLPYEEYVSLISQCSFVVMNHLRQQALSNINAMLFKGGRVFLNSRSPQFRYYREAGVKLHSTEDITSTPELLSTPMDGEDIYTNRQVLRSRSSRAVNLEKTRNLINMMTTKKVSP